MFTGLNGATNGEGVLLDSGKNVWQKIWSTEKEHNREPEWLQVLRRKQNKVNMRELVITVEMVKKQSGRISNWKTSGRNSVQGN